MRFTFPTGFTSKEAKCSINGLSGNNATPLTYLSGRMVECSRIDMNINGT